MKVAPNTKWTINGDCSARVSCQGALSAQNLAYGGIRHTTESHLSWSSPYSGGWPIAARATCTVDGATGAARRPGLSKDPRCSKPHTSRCRRRTLMGAKSVHVQTPFTSPQPSNGLPTQPWRVLGTRNLSTNQEFRVQRQGSRPSGSFSRRLHLLPYVVCLPSLPFWLVAPSSPYMLYCSLAQRAHHVTRWPTVRLGTKSAVCLV